MASQKTFEIKRSLDPSSVTAAAAAIERVRHQGGGLFILTGAGMSVASGVPVFRGADGSMSPDFLRFLAGYNSARKAAGLEEADDWFNFSVPEMFESATAKEAWHYWRWRMLRAIVEPAADYKLLMQLVATFEHDKVFIETSNCDSLHLRAGLHADSLHEIHGSLSRLQCSEPCCQTLQTVDEAVLRRLECEPDWVPMCEGCGNACLRPNVCIFGDGQLVCSEIMAQAKRAQHFVKSFERENAKANLVVLEIGAGVVVPSIRYSAETVGARAAGGLVRINPSHEECAQLQSQSASLVAGDNYAPLVARSEEALIALCHALKAD